MDSPKLWENRQLSIKLLKKIPFFHPFTDGELKELLNDDEFFSKHSKGAVIIKEGTLHEDDLFILIRGEVEITDANSEHIAYLKPGELFGEVTFLTKAEHISNVTTIDDVIVIRIDNDVFERVSKDVQIRMKDGLILTLVEKLVKTNQQLVAKDKSNLELLKKIRELSNTQ